MSSPGPSGEPEFELQLERVDGTPTTITSTARDQILLLVFWETTCEPSRAELPALDRMYQNLQPRGLRLYAINVDSPDTRSRVSEWEGRFSFPIVVDSETTALTRYNPSGDCPFYVVLDASGAMLRRHAGYLTGDEVELEAFLDSHLGRDPSTQGSPLNSPQ